MSTLYLIESTNPTLSASKIDDTLNLTPDGEDYYPLRGNFGVVVPFDIPMDGLPTDLDTLIGKKYLGMLSIYPGYSYILYDEQVDANGWNATTCVEATLGERQTVGLSGSSSALLTSNTSTLSISPTTFIFRFDAFRYFDSNPRDLATGSFERTYTVVDSQVLAEVSFNNGATWNTATSGVLTTIALADQGNQFRCRFSQFSGEPTNIGGWALIY